eukprot:403343866
MSMKDFQIINKIGNSLINIYDLNITNLQLRGWSIQFGLQSQENIRRLRICVKKGKKIDYRIQQFTKVKMLALKEKEKQNSLNEVRILASITHPNIIAYKEAFIEDSSSTLCLVMEYANDGDLYEKLINHTQKRTSMSENQIWNILISMVKALKALHQMKIFHRDLKSANVFLFKDGSAKLGDLNVSKVAQKGLLYTQTGTPYYASPEVWKDQAYDSKSDIWSLGCVLYEMITLKPPFRGNDMNQLYQKVLKGVYPSLPNTYSKDLHDVVKALLQVSPSLRPSCDSILKMDIVKRRMNLVQQNLQTQAVTDNDVTLDNLSLLGTIKLPKNLAQLTKNLPKSNYISHRDKHKASTAVRHERNASQPIIETFGSKPIQDLKIGKQDSGQSNSKISRNESQSFDPKRIMNQQKQLNARQIDDNKISLSLVKNQIGINQNQVKSNLDFLSNNNFEKKVVQNSSTTPNSRDISQNPHLPSSYLSQINSQQNSNYKDPRRIDKSKDYFAELRLPSIPVNNSSMLLADQSRKVDEVGFMKKHIQDSSYGQSNNRSLIHNSSQVQHQKQHQTINSQLQNYSQGTNVNLINNGQKQLSSLYDNRSSIAKSIYDKVDPSQYGHISTSAGSIPRNPSLPQKQNQVHQSLSIDTNKSPIMRGIQAQNLDQQRRNQGNKYW